ncbi:unnamed protein product [Urochloa decumbens]|uniref:Phytocyanin domain-containing protein n=1 Tax=Urochloa decumbens TaxID=240449 RepID=A0ABC8WZL7_9POAL
MRTTLGLALAACLVAAPWQPALAADDHVVGGSGWFIPLSPGLYQAWADNRTVYVGDNLVFRFETGFYDVVQVGRREFDECTADDPYQIYRDGPAAVQLDAKGARYYVCTVGNYCSLGVKMYVIVEPR